jgi:tetratricopeptide (TPR) repeat protein
MRLGNWVSRIAVASTLAAVTLACRAKPQPVMGSFGPPVPEELIQEYVSQGDTMVQAMHLFAWRRAEAAYTQAYRLAARQEIRDKLALTKLLRMTREIDEDIACPTMQADVNFICEDVTDARKQALCDLAQGYAAGPAAAAERLKRVDPSVLNVDTSPLDAYFFMLHARTYGSDPKYDDLKNQLSAKYKDTPLFTYLNFSPARTALARTTAQTPDFAEAWELLGELTFQANQIKQAREAFSKALDLIPDYTRALNGLANIYYFTLEDYANALKGYEAALQWDPLNTGALYGKGASLHSLDRYEDSNRVLDQMLASDLSRRGRVSANSIQYYRGEAYYYQAYNHHLMKDPARARELIDLAKHDLPQAEEINYLSGLLYYNAGQLDAAKTDFGIAAKQGKNCYAYHYLGLIDLKQGGSAAAAQFLTSASCLETSLNRFQDSTKSLSNLDLEPAEKEALRVRMNLKLTGYRDSSAQLIQTMIALIRDAPVEINWMQPFMEGMNVVLSRVQAIVPNKD